jgi:hypothetical protein
LALLRNVGETVEIPTTTTTSATYRTRTSVLPVTTWWKELRPALSGGVA